MQTPPDSPKVQASDARIGTIIADNIRLISILGVGAFGTVYQAHDVNTGAVYAVKALNKLGLDARQQRFQKREVELHYQASCHPNVLSMYRIIDSQDCTYVVLEYCPEGDLFAKITEEGHYVQDDAKARCVFLQLLRAVQYCHSLNIYHRDLKPENIMVADNGASIRLADFGLATNEQISRDFGCGSTFYLSPECQEMNPRPSSSYCTAANDVWSLGVILVNLTCGRNPWKRASMEDSTFRAFRRDPNFLKSILPIGDELNGILQAIFEINPLKRITIFQLISRIEQCSRLTGAAPLSPPDSPVEVVFDHMTEDSLKTIPSLRLPSPRYLDSICTGCLPLTPPRADPTYHPYTSQARSQYTCADALAQTQQQQQQPQQLLLLQQQQHQHQQEQRQKQVLLLQLQQQQLLQQQSHKQQLQQQGQWNWNNCVYPAQQFYYAPYTPVYSMVY